MQNTKIYLRRISQFIDRLYASRYSQAVPLEASYVYDQDNPIPHARLGELEFKPISVGENWGALWGSAWFRFEGTIPQSHAGKEVLALIDVDGEACVFEDGEPVLGLTHKKLAEGTHLKRRVEVSHSAVAGEKVSILIEAGANGLFGDDSGPRFLLQQAELVVFDRKAWELALDLQVLEDILKALPVDTPRAQKILHGLNRIANTWNYGAGYAECKRISEELIFVPANASDMTVYSIGHAHIDLGWLWPVRETKRKGGRTFATALKLMDEYPEYVFGASQPQLYKWTKQEYPGLYDKIREAVREGKWECQGAMWVEPDMNITGGESLVRQCLYGKRYFLREFGKEVRNLWLPDVFGYSAALPQILKKCGVDIFMTQKISWNETNVFPHHTFYWEGIDGTRILTHFLPTNTYNLDNQPHQLIESQKRFAQKDVQNEFLNLYGIGDGGGGPSRLHIERAMRLQNTEGVPRFKFAFSEEFFEKIAQTDPEMLPTWAGELYLELHRGTLTTQGKMKWYNRRVEHRLRDLEILAVAAAAEGASYPRDLLDAVWEDTLLNQFHDILPGSSIGWVYKDAHALSQKNLERLDEAVDSAIGSLSSNSDGYSVINTLSWDRTESVMIAGSFDEHTQAYDNDGNRLPSCVAGDALLVRAAVPGMGYTTITLKTGAGNEAASPIAMPVSVGEGFLENDVLRAELAPDGTISSMVLKANGKEYVKDGANRFLLWEDLPYSWDAWDVSHYYRETSPEAARLVERRVELDSELRGIVYQKFEIGSSVIEERLTLDAGSPYLRAEIHVDWHEEQKLLKLHADTTIHSREATYEIQYGTIKRTTHENTSWDQAQFEVAGQRFADISQIDSGFALINDCKYGYSAYGSSIELSLLRSPNSPDPDADRGTHDIVVGYLPHEENFETSNVFEAAHELNTPLLVDNRTIGSGHGSWFTVDGGGVKIETVKHAEPSIEDGTQDNGIVVRLYETRGGNARVTLSTSLPWNRAFEANLLEEDRTPATATDGKVELDFTPYEIKTIILE